MELNSQEYLLDLITNRLNKNESLYALVDSAVVPNIWTSFEGYDIEYWNLLDSNSADDMEDVAPYLIKLDIDDDGTKWFLDDCKEKEAIVFLSSAESGYVLQFEMQKIMNSQLDDGRKVIFRFYNPVILSRMFPEFDKEQLEELFSLVSFYICEEKKNHILYTFQDNHLKQQKIENGEKV